jgi:hypothetical protein
MSGYLCNFRHLFLILFAIINKNRNTQIQKYHFNILINYSLKTTNL